MVPGISATTGTTADANAAARVYEQLRLDIVRFAFLPGERLVELELTERYKVSRTPVRDALRRLEHEGVLVRGEKGGRFVRRFDISAYEDVYAVRTVLEIYAVRLLCERDGAIDHEALEERWRIGYPSQTTPLDGSYVVPDERFHVAIARETGNAFLASSIEAIHERLRISRSVDFSDRERIVVSESQHLEIAAAIRRRDADAAAALMESHIAQSKREIREISVRILEKLGRREQQR